MIDRRVVLALAFGVALAAGCGSSSPSATERPVATLARPSPTIRPSASATPSDGAGAERYAAYEAVFLRTKVIDGSPEVVVVGVDDGGREREIARLRDAWVAYQLQSGGYLAPTGAVSPSGLLAIPVSDAGSDQPLPRMHWEIVDLRRSAMTPVVVPGIDLGLEQLGTLPYLSTDMEPSVDWSAADRLGLPWRSCDSISCGVWAFFDGHTGEPIRGRPHAEPMCRERDASGAAFRVFDGGLERQGQDGTRTKVVAPSHLAFACLAPDDSMVAYGSGQPPSAPAGGVLASGTGTTFATSGAFAGWLGVDR